MEEKFVRVLFDMRAERLQPDAKYRIYVNNELMNERTWRWNFGTYLIELLQIKAQPGRYPVRIEKATPTKTNFKMENMRVELGDARIVDDTIEIY
jgi:hypothetical protein